MNKIAAFALIILLVPSLASGAVLAQEANNTTSTPANTPTATASPTPTASATPTTTPEPAPTPSPKPVEEVESGPYEISELREGGVNQGVENAPSTRALGDPPRGFAALRYRDPTLFDRVMGSEGSWKHVETGGVVRQNELQFYGSAFGELSGDYELVIVYWQYEERQRGNQTVAVAANQTVDRQQVTISEEELYSFDNVTLEEHTDQTWRVTMWLEDDGEKMDGVQWRFRHRSNPESEEVNISSAAGAWGFAIRNAVLPGIASLIVGLVGARGTLRVTGRGPGYGVGTWLTVTLFIGLIVSLIAYYQIAVVLSNLPWVMGISIGVIAYAAGLTFHQPEKRIGFMRRELADADIIPGGGVSAKADGGDLQVYEDAGAEIFDELTEAIYTDLPEVPAVRTDEGYRVPIRGLRPFFARLFADSALLDMSNIATRQKVKNGRLDDIIMVDPGLENAVEHKPARLVRVLPWDTLSDDADTFEELSAAVMTGLILVGPLAGGMMLFDTYLNLPIIGAACGLVVTAVIAYSAEDGWIDFKPAPPHYKRAEESLTKLQRSYKESKEDQSGKVQAWEEKAKTAKEALDEQNKANRTVTDHILENLGAGDPKSDDREDTER